MLIRSIFGECLLTKGCDSRPSGKGHLSSHILPFFNSCMEVYGMAAFDFVKSAPDLTFLSFTVILWDIRIRSFQSLA
jgi:hypothetical protein